ncbi:hypothetical protein [Dactylosporangium sp. NPDC050588]|uniref:hypothetical protein n=1 Tax=Dactylosporangium sp. NPDC050588 TaxID=3157211 RepID=UPI0033F1B99A
MSEVDHVRPERIAAKLAVARALQWGERPGPWRGNAAEEAEARLARDVPPPFQAVLRFVLRATPDNVDVENWRWGQIPPGFVGHVHDRITGMVSPGSVTTALGAIDETVTGEGCTIHPRAAVQGIADELRRDRTELFTTRVSQAPGR